LIKDRRAKFGQKAPMIAFIFRCPSTAQNVQGWSADDVSAERDVYLPTQCMACRRVHYVNPQTGKVLGAEPRHDSGKPVDAFSAPPGVGTARNAIGEPVESAVAG
jgi:hypothetical protein